MCIIMSSSLRYLPAVIGFCLLPLNILASASFDVVHCFGGTILGANPYGEMVVGNDGCLYGTTSAGGTNGGWGILFKLTTNGSFTSLYSFTDQNDGGTPMDGLLLGNNGDFYGTTMAGGSTGCGTVFEWNANGGLTTLGTFQGGTGGANPESALVQGGAGYLYGTTMATAVVHESYVMGTVFNISSGGGSPQAFDVFQGPPFARPNGLVIGSDGKFYFTTRGGPAFGGFPYNGYHGAIGDTAGDVIYLFSGGNDGAYPHAALVQGSDGFFYGTTHDGGTNGFGVVFKVNSSGLFTNLYSFTNGIDGANPEAKLAQGTDGNFYGTTFAGGAYGFGTVFVIGPSGGLTNLYSFTGQSDGGNPYAGLVQAGDGNFYGSTYINNQGGGSGTLFRITPTGTFTTLVSFGLPTDGQSPEGALTFAADGSLYGLTTTGGTNGAGTIYRLSPDGACSALYSFTGGNDGGTPFGRLAWGNDGNLYGTTRSGGTSNFGTVFKITPAGALTSLYSFTNGSDGKLGSFGLTLGADGTFYGSTVSGGAGGAGTIYNVTSNGLFSLLHSFDGSDGQTSECALTLGPDGWFYGTTDSGGPNNAGNIFKIRPDGLFSNLYSFTGQADGNYPSPVLMQRADGNFYGVCTFGGSNGVGNVFQITSNGVLTVIHHFTGGADGDYPIGGLALGADGNFYGIASDCDGTPRYGTTFQITPGGVLTPLTAFTYEVLRGL